jgi:hypothetical protein
MQVEISTVRVYGSNDGYGGPRTPASGGPVVPGGLAGTGMRCEAYIGAPITWVEDAERLARATVRTLLNGVFGSSNRGDTTEAAIDDLIAGDTLAWEMHTFTTLVVTRKVEVAPSEWTDRPFVWLDPSVASALDTGRETAQSAIDLMAAAVAALINPRLLRAQGKRAFRLPTLTLGSPSLSLVRPGDLVPIDELRVRAPRLRRDAQT